MKKKSPAGRKNDIAVGMLKTELRKTGRGLTAVVKELERYDDDDPIIIIGEPPFPSPVVSGSDCLKPVWPPGPQPKRKRVAYALRALSRNLASLARYLDSGK